MRASAAGLNVVRKVAKKEGLRSCRQPRSPDLRYCCFPFIPPR